MKHVISCQSTNLYTLLLVQNRLVAKRLTACAAGTEEKTGSSSRAELLEESLNELEKLSCLVELTKPIA